jgi:hypothetical protein
MILQRIVPTIGVAFASVLLLLAAVGLTFGNGEAGASVLLAGLAALLSVLSVRAWPAASS